MSRVKDLTGQRFGRLLVLAYAGKDKHRRSLWQCLCECGEERVAVGPLLSRGATSSCGCLRNQAKVKIGQRYGRLVVFDGAGRHQSRRLWRCQCDCGNQHVVASTYLLTGSSTSCGCWQDEMRTINGAKRRGKPVPLRRTAQPSYSAIHHRLSFDRGKASEYECVDCDEQAGHWSYDYSDPHQLSDGGLAYSVDPERYEPRCAPCHTRFDLDHSARNARAEGSESNPRKESLT